MGVGVGEDGTCALPIDGTYVPVGEGDVAGRIQVACLLLLYGGGCTQGIRQNFIEGSAMWRMCNIRGVMSDPIEAM